MSTRAYDVSAIADPAIKAVLFVKLQLKVKTIFAHAYN